MRIIVDAFLQNASPMMVIGDADFRVTDVIHISDENLVTRIFFVTN